LELFSEYLIKLMLLKKSTSTEIYKKIDMSRQTFNKIINSRGIPMKHNVCHIALAMRLTLEESEELLREAGYGLSDCIDYDQLVKKMIVNGYTDEELMDFVMKVSSSLKVEDKMSTNSVDQRI